MSIADFDTGTWTDPWFQKLLFMAKLLFIYLWTNSHKSISGLYVVSMVTISNETGLTEKQIDHALRELSPKVLYDTENSVVCVMNHVKRQFMRTGKISPKIVSAISNSLMLLPESHPFIGVFLNKYKALSIPYPYPIDTLSEGYAYPPSGGGGGGKGKDEDIERGSGGKLAAGFERFWAAYPNKKAKGAAERAWSRIRPNEQLLATMLATIERAKTSVEWTKDNGQYIPHPSTWLNRKGWEDEYTTGGLNERGSNGRAGTNQFGAQAEGVPGRQSAYPVDVYEDGT